MVSKSTTYLKNKANSMVREELFNHRLSYDLKKAAAERAYHLKIFKTTVDFEGHDITIDDNNKIGRYQIKTRFEAKTSSWLIQKAMLLPRQRNAELMRFGNGLCSQNDNGVILIDIKSPKDNTNDFIVDYFYTDYYIIKSIATSLISRPQKIESKAIEIIDQLALTKSTSSKIEVSKSLFVKVKNPSCLLTICGFDSSENKQIEFLMMKLFENNRIYIQGIEEDSSFRKYKKALQNELNDLIDR